MSPRDSGCQAASDSVRFPDKASECGSRARRRRAIAFFAMGLLLAASGGGWLLRTRIEQRRLALEELVAVLPALPPGNLLSHDPNVGDLGYRRWVLECGADVETAMRQLRDGALACGWEVRVSNRSSPRWVYMQGSAVRLNAFVERLEATGGSRIEVALFSSGSSPALAPADRSCPTAVVPAIGTLDR